MAQNAVTDDAGKATVYVYRLPRGSGPPPNSPSVYLRQQELARIQNGRYFSIRLDAGKHSFQSTEENRWSTWTSKPAKPITFGAKSCLFD